jgi:hypothetical protein
VYEPAAFPVGCPAERAVEAGVRRPDRVVSVLLVATGLAEKLHLGQGTSWT